MPMQTEATRRPFTADEYHQMAEAGVFGPEERVELIDGEVIRMSAMGSRHVGCLNRLVYALTAAFGGRAIVSPQNSLRLDAYNEPQPDVAVLAKRDDFYSSKLPESQDACLVVEVSDTTLRFDRSVKLAHYAATGVPELWIADVKSGTLHVYRKPRGREYAEHRALGSDEHVSVEAFPDVDFRVEELIGRA